VEENLARLILGLELRLMVGKLFSALSVDKFNFLIFLNYNLRNAAGLKTLFINYLFWQQHSSI
jgi:hypothetical protein